MTFLDFMKLLWCALAAFTLYNLVRVRRLRARLLQQVEEEDAELEKLKGIAKRADYVTMQLVLQAINRRQRDENQRSQKKGPSA